MTWKVKDLETLDSTHYSMYCTGITLEGRASSQRPT